MKKLLNNKIKLIFHAAILGLIAVLLIMGKRGVELEEFCPFGGILSLGSKLWLGSMSCTMTGVQMFMGIALVLGMIIFGKLFCGYLCPIGIIIDWLNKLTGKYNLSFTIKGVFDRILRSGKYILLFFTAYYSITSSELFCKKFDPYYATVSGFDHDVTLWAGVLAIIAVLVISAFVKFFWCKYICPLGALSNIFANSIVTIPIIAIFIILRIAGVDINILWLILLLVLSGAITEIFRFKFYSISPFKIKVDHNYCTNCKLCNKNCPQGIEVESYDIVDHPDCNLCMDCVSSCETDDSIKLNHGKIWMPALMIIALIVLGYIFGRNFEFKTITERWGDFDKIETVGVMKMEGLRSIKCWGSSMSLKKKLVRIKGIVGLDTWTSNHKIAVFYDNTKMNENDVKKAIFTSKKYKLKSYSSDSEKNLTIFDIPIEGIWDAYDNIDLFYLLKANSGVAGFKTNFGEPIIVSIIYDAEQTTMEDVIKAIEATSYTKKGKDKTEVIESDFECRGTGTETGTILSTDFRNKYFSGYTQIFNSYKKYKPTDFTIFEIGLPDAEKSTVTRRLSYLASHLSFNDGIMKIATTLKNGPVLQVYFISTMTDSTTIHDLLLTPDLKYMTNKDGEKSTPNIFKFDENIHLIQK